ncbi:MAG: PaaI family thioesterase [Acidimicrobiia bacterium]|nr:PaaI family thioesterase [Acidimicrobiia bacterium]
MSTNWMDRYDETVAEGFLGANDAHVGLSSLLGIAIDHVEPGRLRAGLEVTPALVTPIGNLHGGAVAALVDHVLGSVCYPHMERGQWAATTEFKVNYLRPVSDGRLVAEATIVTMTRRTAVVRVDVTNADRLVAAAQGTCTIVDPKA